MAWKTPITDRTQEDIDEFYEIKRKIALGEASEEEISKWMSGMKGALNYDDINRVVGNINFIYNVIGRDEMPSPPSEFATESFFVSLLNELEEIRNSRFGVYNIKIPTRPLNTYSKWNDIEKILERSYDKCQKYIASITYAGEGKYAGDDIGLL